MLIPPIATRFGSARSSWIALWDDLIDHGARPLRAAPVVPVAVVAAVREDHGRRLVSLRGKRPEEGVVDVRVLALVAAAVQEHQQRPALRGAGRLHEGHAERPVGEAALDRDVAQLGAAGVQREDVADHDRSGRDDHE
jgi:hypothetical protein